MIEKKVNEDCVFLRQVDSLLLEIVLLYSVFYS